MILCYMLIPTDPNSHEPQHPHHPVPLPTSTAAAIPVTIALLRLSPQDHVTNLATTRNAKLHTPAPAADLHLGKADSKTP